MLRGKVLGYSLLDMMISKPQFSRPSRLATGTSTLSNSIYVDPTPFLLDTMSFVLYLLVFWKPKRTTGCDTGVLQLATADTWLGEVDNQSRDAILALSACPHSCGRIVCKDGVGDPFLAPVYNVLVALALGNRGNTCNVGASCKPKTLESAVVNGSVPISWQRVSVRTVWFCHG